jgi:hypothetical protein
MKKISKDINQIASRIVEAATNQEFKPAKNPAAVALGRLGGLKGGKARAASLSAKRRKEIARKAIAARWEMAKKKG